MKLNLKTKNETNRKQLNIEIYASTHRELKEISARYGISMKNFVLHAINNAIEGENQQ